ncbi:MAG TPA: TonB-dependent receptor [Lentimicrobium sp.]|nr:TonB-dependent receptor [Lentimicrobium sp.]
MRIRILTTLILFTGIRMLISPDAKSQVSDSIVQLPVLEITESRVPAGIPGYTIDGLSFNREPARDLGEILRREMNISGIRRGGYAIDPVIRGYRYSQISILLDDGIFIEPGCPNRMDPVMAHIEPELIRRIEITKGPYILRYGPSAAASIRLITAPKPSILKKGFNLNTVTGYDANRNGFMQHIGLQHSGDKSFYRISGGFKNYGNYRDGNGTEWKSAFQKRDIAADVGFNTGKSGILLFSYKGSFGRDVLFPALPMDEIADNTHIISAGLETSFRNSPITKLSASLFHTRVYHMMDNSFRPQYSAITPPYTGLMQATAEVNTSATGGRAELSQSTGDVSRFLGIDLRSVHKDGNRNVRMIMTMDGQEFISEKDINLWQNATIVNAGLYSGATVKSGPFEFTTVLRADINHSSSEDTLVVQKDGVVWFDPEPRLRLMISAAITAAYSPVPGMSFGIGLARSSRAPDMQEQYIKFLATGFDRYDYLGNPDLKPETSHQLDLTFNRTGKRLRLDINLFASTIRNFISGTLVPPSVARPLSMGAPGVKQFNNIKRAVLTGFETGVSARFTDNGRISLGVGYTYGYFPETEKTVQNNGQATGTIIIKNDAIAEIPALESELEIGYLFRKIKLRPEVSIRAVAAQSHVSLAFDEEETPGYILTDIAASWTPVKFLTFSAGINNLLDKAYYDHLNRKILGSTERLYEPGRTFFANLKLNF